MLRVEVLLDRAVLPAVAEEDVLGVAEELAVALDGGLLDRLRRSAACRRPASRASAIDPLCSSSSLACGDLLASLRTCHVVLAPCRTPTRRAGGRCPCATLICSTLRVRSSMLACSCRIDFARVPRPAIVRLLLDGELAARDRSRPRRASASSHLPRRRAPCRCGRRERGQLVVERASTFASASSLRCRSPPRRRCRRTSPSSSWRPTISFACVLGRRRAASSRLGVAASTLVGRAGHERRRRFGADRTARRAWPTCARPGTSACAARRRRVIGTFLRHHSSSFLAASLALRDELVEHLAEPGDDLVEGLVDRLRGSS